MIKVKTLWKKGSSMDVRVGSDAEKYWRKKGYSEKKPDPVQKKAKKPVKEA